MLLFGVLCNPTASTGDGTVCSLPLYCMHLGVLHFFFLEAVRTLLWYLNDKKVITRDIFFNYILTQIIYSFSFSLLHCTFFILKIKKQKLLDNSEMRHNMTKVLLHNDDKS